MAERQPMTQVNITNYVIQKDTAIANPSVLRKAKYTAIAAFITDVCLLVILVVIIPIALWLFISLGSAGDNPSPNDQYDNSCLPWDDAQPGEIVSSGIDNGCFYPICFGEDEYERTVYLGNAWCKGISAINDDDDIADKKGGVFSYFFFSIVYFPLCLYFGLFCGLNMALTIFTIVITVPLTIVILILLSIMLCIAWIAFLENGVDYFLDLMEDVVNFARNECIARWYKLVFSYFVLKRYDHTFVNAAVITFQVFAAINNIVFLCYYGAPTMDCNCESYNDGRYTNAYLVTNDYVDMLWTNHLTQVLMIIYIVLAIFVLFSRRIIAGILRRLRLEDIYSVYKPFGIQIDVYQ
eukprot:207504_1